MSEATIQGACSRCRGQLFAREDEYGRYLACVQCGSHRQLSDAQPRRIAARHRQRADERRAALLDYVIGLLKRGGPSPDHAKMAAAVGGISPGTAERYVGELVAWGRLRHEYRGHTTVVALPRSEREVA